VVTAVIESPEMTVDIGNGRSIPGNLVRCVGIRFLRDLVMILLSLPMMSNQNDYQEHYQGRTPLLVHRDS
jgi:hypothetical protein